MTAWISSGWSAVGSARADDFLALAGDHLWQSTLFAAVAGLVALLLKRHSAAFRYWIWFAASAKFLLPVAALVALGGYSSWRTVEIVPYREGPVLIETVGQPFSQDTVRVGTPKQRAGAGPDVISRLPAALLLLWAAGAALFLAHSLRQWWRVRQIARAAVPLTGAKSKPCGLSNAAPVARERSQFDARTPSSSPVSSALSGRCCCGRVPSASD